MVVTLNGRFLTRKGTGVDRVALELTRRWQLAADNAVPIQAAVPCPIIPSKTAGLKIDVRRVGLLQGHPWEQIDLSYSCRDDFLLNLCNTGPLLHVNQLALLHDACVFALPRNFGVSFRKWYQLLLAGLMRRARVVATVSKFSASELQKYLGYRRKGIEVIYPSGEHILSVAADQSILRRLKLEGVRYLLGVGSLSPHKNFSALAAAACLLEDDTVKVVVVGSPNSRIFVEPSESSRHVVYAGHVSDSELRALYEGAQCFLFPSLYEGFGLPPLEAMNCGCPVIVSHRASMPEVCGQAALYCDPDNPDSLYRQIVRLLSSDLLRQELREAGRARASQFTWMRASTNLFELSSAAIREAA